MVMLGGFRISIIEDTMAEDASRVQVPLPATTKAQSLLAYLLLHRQTAHTRDRLATLCWGDRTATRARRSLSTALWRIRRCFAPYQVLHADHRSVTFDFPGPVELDVEAFEHGARTQKDWETLQAAVDLYGGTFLPSLDDDWVVEQRRWLEALYQQALMQLMEGYEADGEEERALHFARQALAMDPCNERAHRTVMRVQWRLGRRAAALEQYERCRLALQQELHVAPSPETQALYQALRASDAAKEAPVVLAPPWSPPVRVRLPADEEAASSLVGREKEMAFLLARWRDAAAGHGGMVFLRGEAGIGKTRLLNALAQRVAAQHGRVLAAACYEYEQTQPYSPLIDLLRAGLAASDEDLTRQLSSWQLAHLARLVPEMRDRLPPAAAYMIDADLEQKHLLAAFTRWLILLARRAPVLVILDDLHWAHESVLAWLPVIAARAAQAPVLVAAAYRSEEVAPGDLLTRIVAQLEAEGRCQTRTLPRLSAEHLSHWLTGLDEESVGRIHRHTEGNPFFVQETVRALLEQGHLQQADGRYRTVSEHFTPPLPESVRQTIAMRLDALPATARQGVAVAAVIGRVFDLDVWMAVWGLDETTELEALDELLRRRVLREGQGLFARDYEFDHRLVQETVYQAIPPRRRQQLHARTARVLEKLRGGEPAASAQIALHYLRAGQPGQARPWLLAAGDQAVSVAATTEALRFYRRALAGYPQDEAHRFERAVLERKMGEIHFRRGEYDQADHSLRHALELLRRPFPEPGWPLHRAVAAELARQVVHRITPSRGPVGGSAPARLREEVAAYLSLGWMYSLQSRYEAYLLVSLRALNRSEEAGYARGIAVAATALGIAADFMAQFGLAEYFHRQAQAAVANVARPADVGFVAFGQAYHAYLVGEEEVMLAQARQAAANYQQAGDVHRWSLAMLLQGYVLTQREGLQDAEALGWELVKTGQALQDAEVRCAGESLLGLVGFWQGRWQEAAAHHVQAVALAERVPDYMSLVENLAGRGRCLLRLGRWEEARQVLEQARTAVLTHDIKGDVVGKFSVAALELALWAAEHPPEAHGDWLAQAKGAMAEARKQAQAFRPAQPEVWRLCGRYEWLRGRPDAARKWWEKSLARAEALDHRLDWAVTALEMGQRLDMPSLRAQGRARLEAAGARGEWGLENPIPGT